jgi:uncharacterized membrane protein YsdA (DUF1294 family)
VALLCIVALCYLVVMLARSEREEEIGWRIDEENLEAAPVSGPWNGRAAAGLGVEGA